MIKLAVTNSDTLFGLLASQPLDIDFIKVDADKGMDNLRQALAYKPVLLHDVPDPFWLNYESPFQDEVMHKARALLDAAQSPWFSTGIGASAEPQAHRFGPYREADASQLQPRERVISNIIKHGRRLKDWVGVPLLLENYNYHPTNAYEYVCEPDVVQQVIGEVGCEMLLDLAHAQISAHNMGWPSIEKYLQALPLDKVREIHTNHPIRGSNAWLDGHQPMQQRDLDLLAWTMERTPMLEAVTLEVEDIDEPLLVEQVAALRKVLAGR
jgi:uncharacterized protein (UPF0276 family)